MAFPSRSILDNFNRPNEGPPMTGWTDIVNGLKVDMLQCVNSLDGFSLSLWSTLLGVDRETYITVTVRPADRYEVGIVVFQDENNYAGFLVYRDDNVNDEINVWETISGLNNKIGGPYTITYRDGDAFGLRIVGTTIETWYKPTGGAWTLLGSSITSLIPASGYIGLHGDGDVFRFDGFGGGDVAITLDLADGIEVGETPSPPTFVIGLVLSDSVETQDVIGAMAQISGTLIELHDHASGYAPAHVLNLVEGDRLPVLVFSLTDANGGAFDLSAATTTLRVRARDAKPGTFIINEICDYVPISGYVQYDLQAGDLDAPGEYYCDLQVDLGRLLTSEIFLIRIREAL